MKSPSQIVRAYLIAQEIVQIPLRPGVNIGIKELAGGGPILCFVSSMPDDYDDAVMIKGMEGRQFGRLMHSGRTVTHPSVKILIRSGYYPTGSSLAQTIANALDNFRRSDIIVDDETYNVQSIYRTSAVIEVGEEVGKKRQLFTINARVALQDPETPLG